MAYQNLRGGRVTLGPLAPPVMEARDVLLCVCAVHARLTSPSCVRAQYGNAEDGTSDALSALSAALALERMNYEKLLELRAVAEKVNDVHLQGYCDTLLLDQVASVRKCADYVAQVKRCGAGYGEWSWDRQLFAELNGAAPATEPVGGATGAAA